MSFAAGIGAGFAIGIGSGIAAGQRRTVAAISAHANARDVSLTDAAGHVIDLDRFIDEAMQVEGKAQRPKLLLLLAAGLVLLVAGVAFYWLRAGAP